MADLRGANLRGANLEGADLAGADLRDAVLVGAKTLQWNVSNANMAGTLTDKPAGIAAASLPYKTMIQDHARWCETGGQQGSPSVFDGADLRALETVRGYNLTALSAKGAVDKSLKAALSAMNLPSTSDLEALKAQLDALETAVASLEAKVTDRGEKRER